MILKNLKKILLTWLTFSEIFAKRFMAGVHLHLRRQAGVLPRASPHRADYHRVTVRGQGSEVAVGDGSHFTSKVRSDCFIAADSLLFRPEEREGYSVSVVQYRGWGPHWRAAQPRHLRAEDRVSYEEHRLQPKYSTIISNRNSRRRRSTQSDSVPWVDSR